MAQVQVQPQPPLAATNGLPAASAAAEGSVNPLPSTSLYVGDLDLSVTDEQLYDIFGQVGHVMSVRVCRDINTRRSLGYAYVNFTHPGDAAKAIEVLNFIPLNGKPIRIMYSNRDPSLRKSGTANIFIKNLDKAIDNKALLDTFSAFGNILSCKIATDASGQSKGYGFVQFEQEDAAQNAIEKLNGMCLNDKLIYVGPFHRKLEKEDSSNISKFNNVFVKNLSESTTEDHLNKIFGEYGTITSLVIMREGDGTSKCFGFVNFENPHDAARVVNELNGKKFDDKEWYVGKAQKKSDRELELKEKFELSSKEYADKHQGLNLFLKNLDDSIGDEKLKELFSKFGTITSCKVMRDPNGTSKGSGFVAFSTSGEASRALLEMNGKLICGKPLYVALAQRKEERRAQLQAQFAQTRPVSMATTGAPRMPMYSPGALGMGQQVFYGQGHPGLIPPQQQQLVPRIRGGGGAPMPPNFFMPFMEQVGQQAQRLHGRRAPQQPPFPMMAVLRGRAHGHPPMRGILVGGPPPPAAAMTSALANATPDQQRTILGESLYPMVDELEHENAAKVTGMLLEMDQTEVLHLLESPEALKTKVAEAMDVLQNITAAAAAAPGDALHAHHRLAALSLS